MTLPELFSELNQRGLRLEVVSGRLSLVGNHAGDCAFIQAAVREHETDLLGVLGLAAPVAPIPPLIVATDPPATQPPAVNGLAPPFDGEWVETHETRNGQPIVAFTRPGIPEDEAWWHKYDSFDDLPEFPPEPVEQTTPRSPGAMILRVCGRRRPPPRTKPTSAPPGLFLPETARSFCLLSGEETQ